MFVDNIIMIKLIFLFLCTGCKNASYTIILLLSLPTLTTTKAQVVLYLSSSRVYYTVLGPVFWMHN